VRAAFIRQHGGPEVIEVGEVPTPQPGEGQVQVRVRAAALNRLDLYTRAGLRGTQVPAEKMPHVLGGDCAGEVSAVGAGVTDLTAGQRVVVNPLLTNIPYPHMVGTHAAGSDAEYVVVPAANAVPIPDALSFEQAAALPTVYLPTWSIIMREGRMQAGETALVLSASSGVGTAAIQIVKGVVGGRCIAVTSTPEKVAAAKALGADETINYKDESLAERVKELTGGKGVDLVVDSTGALFFEDAYGSLARGGRYGICGVTSGYKANLHLGQLFTKELRVYGVFMGTNTELAQIVEAAGAGKVASAIHRTVGLEGLAEAHAEMERSEHFGKFVVTID
jgi:NADPH:quinone reductase-like Zn-dependent oxidoreductase